METIASSIDNIYLYSAGLAPCIFGYVAGRHLPAWLRVLPLIPIVLAGVWYVLLSAHAPEVYWLGTVLYTICCICGCRRRSDSSSKPFWSLRHFDWILLSMWIVLFTLCYGLVCPSL